MTIAPADRGIQVVTIYSFFAALTTITILLRTYCRVYIQKAFGWDDWVAVFAWVRRLSRMLLRLFHLLMQPCRWLSLSSRPAP